MVCAARIENGVGAQTPVLRPFSTKSENGRNNSSLLTFDWSFWCRFCTEGYTMK